jgi:hypothetical protein
MNLPRSLPIKSLLAFLLTIVISLFLASCGGSGDSSVSSLPPTDKTVEVGSSSTQTPTVSTNGVGSSGSPTVSSVGADITTAPIGSTSGTAKLVDTKVSQIYFTPAKIADDLAVSPDQWTLSQARFQGVWMNGTGAGVANVPIAIGMLDLNSIPTILPAACGLSANLQAAVCDSDSSYRRMNTSNKRLAGTGKVLVPTDRVFNLNDVLRKIPADTLIQNLQASKQQAGFEQIRMGILVHPGDGNPGANIDETRKVIDAVDAGGVVAIEASPSLMDSRIFLEGSAAIWTYAQSKGKRAVWLMNGPVTATATTTEDVTNWIDRSKSAQDYWKTQHNLTLDILAPIATRGADTLLPTLGEGDGKWPPQRTFMSWVLSLMGLNG